MRFQKKPIKVTAVQWKGWPHKIKGIVEHPKYPQCAMLSYNGYEICKGDWIITHKDKSQEVLGDYSFYTTYEKI